MNKLQAISEFIALKTPELQLQGIPLTLCCGLVFVLFSNPSDRRFSFNLEREIQQCREILAWQT
ncbi:MAG: hypothetical protein KME12_27100 [Trichocoleus desertorum ATA4-8-CV12]|jgi:hypothetical protein|nr:hypothetical protein [Trichocoleus desertorum ATA4-8-CV12]